MYHVEQELIASLSRYVKPVPVLTMHRCAFAMHPKSQILQIEASLLDSVEFYSSKICTFSEYSLMFET